MQATYIDHGGTDLSVVNAARVSFSNSSDWADRDYRILKDKDRNLIQYLARGMPKAEWQAKLDQILGIGAESTAYDDKENRLRLRHEVGGIVEDLMYMAQHWVPFTHTMISLHMVAPVPIARQCFKHKIGFTESEESRRYISGTPNLYIPEAFRAKADNVKQGSGGRHAFSDAWLKRYKDYCMLSIMTYEEMIEDGVAPEQARFVLPQGCEVEWIWTGNLASFARYYNQRTDSHAQLESQQLAKQVGEIIRPLFPVSWDALTRSGRTDVE